MKESHKFLYARRDWAPGTRRNSSHYSRSSRCLGIGVVALAPKTDKGGSRRYPTRSRCIACFSVSPLSGSQAMWIINFRLYLIYNRHYKSEVVSYSWQCSAWSLAGWVTLGGGRGSTRGASIPSTLWCTYLWRWVATWRTWLRDSSSCSNVWRSRTEGVRRLALAGEATSHERGTRKGRNLGRPQRDTGGSAEGYFSQRVACLRMARSSKESCL